MCLRFKVERFLFHVCGDAVQSFQSVQLHCKATEWDQTITAGMMLTLIEYTVSQVCKSQLSAGRF